MKTWKSFGSAHSASLTVIGEFNTVEDAKLAKDVLEDFVIAASIASYPDVRKFIRAWWHRRRLIKAWKDRLRHLDGSGPTQAEFDMGLHKLCTVGLAGTTVTVTVLHTRTVEIRGILKLMLLNSPTEIRIPGGTWP
jgi:hypothetical protein